MSGEFVRDYDQIDNNGKYTVLKEDRCYPVFTTKFRQNKVESLKQGHIVGETVEMVEVMVAGDPKQAWFGKVTNEHRERWPRQYKAWKSGEEAPIDGTPLEQWPVIGTSFLHQLKALGLRTVEQMSNLTDAQCQNFMGGMDFRKKAKEYLAKDGTAADKTIRDLQARIAAMEAAPVAAPVPVDMAAMVADAVAKALAVSTPPKKPLSEKKKAALENMRAKKLEKKAAKEV